MKKLLLLFITFALTVFVVWQLKSDITKEDHKTESIVSPAENVVEITPTPVDFAARFEVYTLGTKRVFTDKRYHDQSETVFIPSSDPGTIHINKKGVTWSDFFETLPMELTRDCLTTGTGQVFCSNDKNALKFYINNKIDQNALEKTIKDKDFLRVTYE